MKINQPLDRKYGDLGVKFIPNSTLINNPKNLFFVGYSGGFSTEQYQKYFTTGNCRNVALIRLYWLMCCNHYLNFYQLGRTVVRPY